MENIINEHTRRMGLKVMSLSVRGRNALKGERLEYEEEEK